MDKQILRRFYFVVGIALLAGVVALPASVFSGLLGEENPFVAKMESLQITLGLDLAGGTELDYRVDLSDALAKNEDDDPLNDLSIQDLNIVAESVRDALERRVNPAGVGEVIVKRSQVDGEEHVLVQLPPSSNVDKAKRDAEKDNRLEFFEENPGEEMKARIKIAGELSKINSFNWGSKVSELTADELVFHEVVDFKFEDQIQDTELASKLFAASDGDVLQEVVETQTEMVYNLDESGKLNIESFPKSALALVRVTGKKNAERDKHVSEKAHARHILFGYPGALRALDLGGYETVEEALEKSQVLVDGAADVSEEDWDSEVIEAQDLMERIEAFHYKSKEEARAKAEELLARLKEEGTDEFYDLAKEFSTEPSAQRAFGDLGTFEPGRMVGAFDQVVFFVDDEKVEDGLEVEGDGELGIAARRKRTEADPVGLHSEVVETDFGFHVVDVMSFSDAYEEKVWESQVKYEMIAWDRENMNWLPTELGGAHLESARVGYDQVGQPLVNLYFSVDGGDLFAEMTGRVASRTCPSEGGGSLCRLGIKVGGNWVSRATVREKIIGRNAQITGGFDYQQAHQLSADLNLGAIDAPVILSGQTTIDAALGADQLSKSLKAAAFGLLATMVFMMFGYRFAGVVASLSLLLYVSIFVAILKTWPVSFGGPIVLSLAGVAGIALSVGLAVDGNILIFERMKEEFVARKNLAQAVDLGFERAWTSIRDSNLTTLLTCIILFSMGSSIVRGFAITLIVGTILSMFTAVVISRNLLRFVLLFPALRKPWLFGISGKFVEKVEKAAKAKIRKRK